MDPIPSGWDTAMAWPSGGPKRDGQKKSHTGKATRRHMLKCLQMRECSAHLGSRNSHKGPQVIWLGSSSRLIQWRPDQAGLVQADIQGAACEGRNRDAGEY